MTSNTQPNLVTINILGKEYRMICAKDEEHTLIISAQELDEQMREIRDSGRVNGSDRVAVMAALNLARELHEFKNQASPKEEISGQLTNLREKIENTLKNSESS
ncbi:MAG: cell division protein ZapA [Methylococcales bacterium]|nr:cell division protein ZapA [Methylococcales bacterium]